MAIMVFNVSFPLQLYTGTRYEVEGTAVAVWREYAGDRETLLALDEVAMTSATVDGAALSDEEFAAFYNAHGALMKDTLQWLATSTLDGAISGNP